jgi:hypothetical protein
MLSPGVGRIALRAALGLAFYFIGASVGSTHSVTTYPVTKTVTVTVTQPPLPVPTPVSIATIPQSCLGAIMLLNKLAPAVHDIINVSTSAMDALSAGELALIQGDQKGIIAATNKLQQLDNGLSGPADRYMSLLTNFTTASTSCTKDLEPTPR